MIVNISLYHCYHDCQGTEAVEEWSSAETETSSVVVFVFPIMGGVLEGGDDDDNGVDYDDDGDDDDDDDRRADWKWTWKPWTTQTKPTQSNHENYCI